MYFMRLRYLSNLLLTTLSVWVVVSILKHLERHPPRPPTPPVAPVTEPPAAPAKPMICIATATISRNGAVSTHLVRSVPNTLEPDFDYAIYLAHDDDDEHFIHAGNRSAYAAHAAPVPVHWLAVSNRLKKPGPAFNAITAHAVASGCAFIYRSVSIASLSVCDLYLTHSSTDSTMIQNCKLTTGPANSWLLWPRLTRLTSALWVKLVIKGTLP